MPNYPRIGELSKWSLIVLFEVFFLWEYIPVYVCHFKRCMDLEVGFYMVYLELLGFSFLWEMVLNGLCVCVWCVCACSVVSDSLQPFARLLCPWNFPGENIGAGCHLLLQDIFLTHVSCISSIGQGIFFFFLPLLPGKPHWMAYPIYWTSQKVTWLMTYKWIICVVQVRGQQTFA